MDLEALAGLEDEKRATPHGDPRLVELAIRIEELARRVLQGSGRQRDLTETISESTAHGASDPSLTITETSRSPSTVLAEWRAAERRARAADPGSVEAIEAETLAERLRDEYRRAFEALNGD